jgi:hypothetical protein
MAMSAFETYIRDLQEIRATGAGVKEKSYYVALGNLLNELAKDAKARVEKTDLPALETLRKALEEALGITFTGDRKDPKKGERFFKSTLVQTLFYGIFSAWVLWHKQQERGRFDWRVAGYYLHVPMIKALFEKVATPTHVRRLDLEEVLNWTGDALNRVDRTSFFSKFEEGQAVQYFYEPFLEAFDPQLRKELGVWYTPPEIVQYMVARVDTVLREELQIEDGLADPNVYILDPCCGTGAFLVEVLRRIDANLQDKGLGALVGSQLKAAAMNRVFGFEISTAPFVVAHLQLGLLLQNLGVPLGDEQEWVGVYLTNALTGWKPPDPEKEKFMQLQLAGMPELKEERDAAERIKQSKRILVVLGNPPYNITAGWGYAGQNGVTMPGKGKVVDRDYLSEEIPPSPPYEGGNQTGQVPFSKGDLGGSTHDIYLNDIAYWKNIPERVWEYTIGGYQVIKKWLSYREQELLGRSLKEEVMEVTNMARRIAAILLLELELNANYGRRRNDGSQTR